MTGLNKEIQAIVRTIRDKYKPSSIILFGSAARGKFREGSDLDFFVVKNTKKPRHQRARDIYRLISNIRLDYPCDFIVYTPFELRERIALGDFFVKDILNEGERLYDTRKPQIAG